MGGLPFFDRFEIRSIVSQRCLRAHDKQTGLNVLIHVTSPDLELAPLLKRRALLVCEGSQEGIDYAATPDREDLLDLAVWKSLQCVPPDLLAPRKPAETRPPAAPSDSTVMFAVPNSAEHRAAPAMPEPALEDEFTAMFQAPEPQPEPHAASQPQKEESEFTAMFRAASPVKREASLEDTQELRTPNIAELGPPPTQPVGETPGEFTAMFRTPPAPAPEQPPAPPPDSEATRIFPSTPAPSAAGEFTAMFRTPPPVIPERPAASAPEPSAAPPPSQATGGEFTAMFRTPPSSAPEQPRPAPSTPGASDPGEFTRLFQSPGAPPQARSPIPAPQPSGSEFDRFFNAPYSSDPEAEKRLSGPAIPDAPSTRNPGEFTRLFSDKDLIAGSAGPSSATGAFAVPSGPPPEEPVVSGPSEYTKLFQTPAAVKSEPAPAPAPAAELEPAAVQAPSKFPNLLMWILLGLLACAAIAVVVFFVIRH
jgi:hypothetical protein